jgi:23S rRNA pseudoU1915 N3-methylase RlmH
MNQKINNVEYDSLCNIVASNETNEEFIDIDLSHYLEKEVEEPQEILELEPDNEKNEENIDENQEKENQILLEKFKNHPSFPILERFMNIEV